MASKCILSHSFSWHRLTEKSKKLCCTFHHPLQIKPLLKSELAKQRQQKWRKPVIKAGCGACVGAACQLGSVARMRDVWNSHDDIKVKEWDNTRKWHRSKHIWKWKDYVAAWKVHIFISKNRWWERWQKHWGLAVVISGAWAMMQLSAPNAHCWLGSLSKWIYSMSSCWHLYAERVFRLIIGNCWCHRFTLVSSYWCLCNHHLCFHTVSQDCVCIDSSLLECAVILGRQNKVQKKQKCHCELKHQSCEETWIWSDGSTQLIKQSFIAGMSIKDQMRSPKKKFGGGTAVVKC